MGLNNNLKEWLEINVSELLGDNLQLHLADLESRFWLKSILIVMRMISTNRKIPI